MLFPEFPVVSSAPNYFPALTFFASEPFLRPVKGRDSLDRNVSEASLSRFFGVSIIHNEIMTEYGVICPRIEVYPELNIAASVATATSAFTRTNATRRKSIIPQVGEAEVKDVPLMDEDGRSILPRSQKSRGKDLLIRADLSEEMGAKLYPYIIRIFYGKAAVDRMHEEISKHGHTVGTSILEDTNVTRSILQADVDVEEGSL